MPETKARDLMKKHKLSADDLKEGKPALSHLRKIVRDENLSFDVFRTLVRLRH